jgi:hypothetical protein
MKINRSVTVIQLQIFVELQQLVINQFQSGNAKFR